MQIIITGASGFVGTHLSAYLAEKGHETKPLSLRAEGWQEQINRKADALIHLAGKAHDTSNTSAPEEYFRVNRDLSIRLFDLFLETEISDFIFFSSVKAAADTVSGVLTEEAAPHPLTPYGQSKLEAERYLLSRELPEGKRLFILRPCMIHGPGNKGNLNLLYQVVAKGIPWPLAAFENRRSFLSVENACFLVENILTGKHISSGIYNLADDTPLSTNELIRLIASSLKRKPRLWAVSPGLMQKIAGAGDRLRLPLNSERLKKLTESYVVSGQKIKTTLSIDRMPLSAEEGLLKTLQSFGTDD